VATSVDVFGSEGLWRELYDAVLAIHDGNIAALTRRGLTGGEIKAVLKLHPGEAVPMRELAERWRSDASTATWMADRLEVKGLIERRPQPGDRRIRAVALTAKGVAELAAIHRQLYRPPDWWTRLPAAQLRQLRKITERLRDEPSRTAERE
jgi:DNA-binding MarR family transcriptional regulator